jgi:NAD(P)-dependent dehydrogenase (short-subunit alcohol dehydrogenase family)
MKKDSVGDCSSDSLNQVMATNVIAVNSLNQHLLPLMPTSSSVLYIGSTLSEKAVSGSFSYVISKHAQLGMMRATCQDLMGSGLHTAMICPGFTDTEMLRTHLGSDPDIEAGVAAMNSFDSPEFSAIRTAESIVTSPPLTRSQTPKPMAPSAMIAS